jgi:hypothetical protein
MAELVAYFMSDLRAGGRAPETGKVLGNDFSQR